MNGDGAVIFHEEQQFRQPGLWALMGVTLLAGLAPILYGMVQQLVFGIPWGNHPTSNGALVLIGASVMAVEVGVFALLWSARLTTEVRSDGLYVQFFPFHRTPRRFGFDELVSSEARTYRPLAEYGGWGLKYGPSGEAWNVSGDRGVQLKLANGRSLLIGSQRADELVEAIRQTSGGQRTY
jgi:hypothetical protein